MRHPRCYTKLACS